MRPAFACHSIPKVVTSDGGPPYGGREMADYCEGMGFKHRITMPEDAQANGFTKAFLKVLIKLVLTAVLEKRDPKRSVNRYLMVYRATPHRITGKSPVELMFGRQIQSKLPRFLP